jgi:hypothetical protein
MLCAFNSVIKSDPSGANIYRVFIGSQAEAEAVTALGVNAIMRVSDGYLVHTLPEMESALRDAGITFELVVVDIVRSRLAIDIRHNHRIGLNHPIIYEDKGLRLYYVAPDVFRQPAGQSGITPLLSDNLPVRFHQPQHLDLSISRDMMSPDSLASLISVDSCQSYVVQLQDFQTRMVGTDSNYASRDWIIDKFHEFGYDSVFTDTFPANSFEGHTGMAHNVIACKTGSLYPRHQIVIGAHRDSYPLESPGADDNASGTAGVLEIARALSDIDTKLTFVFVAFDAEEMGLFGSWKYATDASARGDSIVLMLNMDCIGYASGSDSVALNYAPNESYAQLWIDLCDSIEGVHLFSIVEEDVYADELPFFEYGYEVLATYEYFITPLVHTPHDSSVYFDFGFMSDIIKVNLATAYTISEQYIPAPSLVIDYPDGVPAILFPNQPFEFGVDINGYAGGTIVPGSEILHYSFDGVIFQEESLSILGEGTYQASGWKRY